ncbi:hypothetical protein [Euzebya rosea]|uniref:hypothetical protein n=1 Tax=Euzebya rosea TaxID=2052804 RepID=UPI0013008867|nr:hypothetical protein [Euzebya rosea]
MHMPEAELRAFLRVFLPEERVEPALDSIALMGLEIEATDPLELFVLAHMEVEPDPRVTLESEAVVLVEEVGLDAVDVSAILGIEESAVIEAVDRAWADHGNPEASVDADAEVVPDAAPDVDVEPEVDAAPEVDVEPEVDAAPEVDVEPESMDRTVELPGLPLQTVESSASAPDIEAVEGDAPPVLVAPRRRPWGAIIGTVAAVVTIGGLGLVATSEAGQQILAMQGIDPFVFVAVIFGLVFGGIAFVRAGSTPPPVDQPVGPDPDGSDTAAARDEVPHEPAGSPTK